MKKSAWFLLCVFGVLLLASCMVARPALRVRQRTLAKALNLTIN